MHNRQEDINKVSIASGCSAYKHRTKGMDHSIFGDPHNVLFRTRLSILEIVQRC